MTTSATKPEKKIIGIIGATGAQGGGLARAILNDKDKRNNFGVRALTRDPSKPSAVALKEAGAEVVAFDMDSDMTTLAKALEGVYGLFVITNFWEVLSPGREQKQAMLVIEAGKLAGVEHFVWSTLEDTVPFFDSLPESDRPPKINGTYVPHFDGKGQINEAFPRDKTTILYTSFYLENFYLFGQVQDGVFRNTLGDEVELPVIAVEDIGKCVYAIFQAGNKHKGKSVYLAGDRMTSRKLMEQAKEVIGQDFSHKRVTRQEYANLGFPGADDLANMYEYMRLNGAYSAALDPAQTKLIYPFVQSASEWFAAHQEEMKTVGTKMITASEQR